MNQNFMKEKRQKIVDGQKMNNFFISKIFFTKTRGFQHFQRFLIKWLYTSRLKSIFTVQNHNVQCLVHIL